MPERGIPDYFVSGYISQASLEVQTFTCGSSNRSKILDLMPTLRVGIRSKVPERGLEPPWIAPLPPQGSASTISPPGLQFTKAYYMR